MSCKSSLKNTVKDQTVFEITLLEDIDDMYSFINEHRIKKNGKFVNSISKNSDYEESEKVVAHIRLTSTHKQQTIEDAEIINGYVVGVQNREFFGYPKRKEYTVVRTVMNKGKKGLHGAYNVYSILDSLLYCTQFKKGTGYWKDYYYAAAVLREEGNVIKNKKHGKWVYYAIDGSIDSTKTYTHSDQIDVRYPHCFFNPKEKCY